MSVISTSATRASDCGSIDSQGQSAKRRSQTLRQVTQWRWHLDEVFVKTAGGTQYLWRAIDHEGDVLEAYVTRTRDKKAALKFLRNAMVTRGSSSLMTGLVRCSDEGDWKRGKTASRTLSEQPSKKLTPAVPTTRTGHVIVLADAKFAKIRRNSLFGSRPFQLRPPPLRQSRFQNPPRCRPHRSAVSQRGLIQGFWFLLGSGSRVRM